MPKSTKLSDIELILLTTASRRPDGSLLPAPSSVSDKEEPVRKAVANLVRRGFAAEQDVRSPKKVWRSEDDRHIGATVTDTGLQALNIEESAGKEQVSSEAGSSQANPGEAPPSCEAREAAVTAVRAGTKQALLIEMLQREHGASITELVEAMGWLPHTTRAALTGLRKKGYNVTSAKVEGVSRYRLGAAAA